MMRLMGCCQASVALMLLLGLNWQITRDWHAVRDREKTLKELRKAAGNGAVGSIIGRPPTCEQSDPYGSPISRSFTR